MKKSDTHIDKTIIIIGVLILSVLVNIYMFSKINNYKYSIGKESYSLIEDIKQRNESNMNILSKSIEKESIKNDEILTLYRNYDIISTETIELWQQYNTYTQNDISIFSKNIKTDKVVENDIHGKIEEYMLSALKNEMKNEKTKLLLEDNNLECFKSMYDMSERLYIYFNDFNKNELNNIEGEEKEKKIIKKHYWIDMLEGIYDISNDYADVQWNIISDDDM